MATEHKFIINEITKDVTAEGVPELDGLTGFLAGDGMAFFIGEGYGNYEFFIANTATGKVRKLVTSTGEVLIGDSEIDMDAVESKCKAGVDNAKRRLLCNTDMNRGDGFKSGLCALRWRLTGSGGHFAGYGGYGGRRSGGAEIHAFINTDLELVVPFQPMEDVRIQLITTRHKLTSQNK